jgi:hypothetical protein
VWGQVIEREGGVTVAALQSRRSGGELASRSYSILDADIRSFFDTTSLE